MDENINAYYSAISQASEANNAWSAEQAQKQMDFQERMSNTAHQREVADLRAAGLNPVLSAGGAGATTGSGAMASRSDQNVDALYGLVSKAFEAQIENAKAEQVSAKAITGVSANPLEDAFADIVKRKLGINQDTTKAIVNRVGSVLNVLSDKGQSFLNYLDKGSGYDSLIAGASASNSAKGANDSSDKFDSMLDMALAFKDNPNLESDYFTKIAYGKSKQFFKSLFHSNDEPYQFSVYHHGNGSSGRAGTFSKIRKKLPPK